VPSGSSFGSRKSVRPFVPRGARSGRASPSALGERVEVLLREAGKIARDERRIGELAQRARERVGHRQRAAGAELRLHIQVGQGVLGDRRQRLGPAEHAAPVRHRREAVRAEGDFFQAPIRRMLLDPLPILARARAVMEHRRVAVGGRGEPVELVARQCAEALEVRAQVRKELRLHVVPEEPCVLRVRVEEVGAAAVGQRQASRRRIGGLHYSRNEGSRRSSIRSSAGHSSSVILRRLPGA